MTILLPDETRADGPVTIFGPDFPFAYDDWVTSPHGLGELPPEAHGAEVAVVGAGLSGMVAAWELMNLGARPVIYEATRIGGRLRTHEFEAARGVTAELGGMRFPVSGSTFFHYADRLGLHSRPFPNPLTPAAGSTVIDIGGETYYGESLEDLPELFSTMSGAWDEALRAVGFEELQEAIRRRDVAALKQRWDTLVAEWDERTFYDFVASSQAFSSLPFEYRELFGVVGFGTGGWDSDFPNSMLEILRVVLTNCDTDQRLIDGGSEQLPRGLWTLPVREDSPWPAGTTLASLHANATLPAAAAISRAEEGRFDVRDRWGVTRRHDAVLATCQSWLLTTEVEVDEELFSQSLWMALDRTRYMQSTKTFVMVDQPFWKDVDPETGRHVMSMTLTDRLTRGTYLFDNGPDRPAVICLSYSWMSDSLKMLPHPVERRVELALAALAKIYPGVDIRSRIVGDPVTVSWEDDPHFLGAFKGALPGHYRYNHRMYTHFVQRDLPASERGIFLAGDDVSFTPAWAEGAVQTALNAVWGVMTHLGGRCHPENPGPGDRFDDLAPVALP
ncbi:tryptophan synthase subunit alpha [Marmoricola endophyticus]|uniref:Tryptophan synthase subunit alpha n=1 Tax=Marmoricola endophyticus TaxID=2040280 RepID=A0A917BIL5_9ACTN|nr:NAD(P)/FAD-dependent oxidoreductase [Marmoricola endophyticus]GGF46333.1 tryptophan synthase subunit alpha [Marmoricola endophyticus]